MGKQSQGFKLDDSLAVGRGGPPPQYIDLDKLRNADGISAIISQRIANGVITFGIFKEFVRDGREERTTFIAESLLASYESMLEITKKRIADIRFSSGVLEELQRAAIAKLTPPDQAHVERALRLKPVEAK